MRAGTSISAIGLPKWLMHRLSANYWSLPSLAVLAAPFAAAILVALDRNGFAAFIDGAGLAPVVNGDTAKDLANVLVGVDTALLTLFFSISLLVLTLAASSLGVRLIDRWLDKTLVRFSIAGLAFSVIYGMAVSAAIDAEATAPDVPLGAFSVLLLLQMVNIAMLCVALNDLGRSIFVDREIARIAHDVVSANDGIAQEAGHPGPWRTTAHARSEGYVEGIDIDRTAAILDKGPGAIRFLVAPGQHVLPGEAIVRSESGAISEEDLSHLVAIGAYRSDSQGAVFRIRLLVEIGARALSPAVNDFYTALACADRIAYAMKNCSGRWVEDGRMPVFVDDHRIELPGQDFFHLFDRPLKSFRQAAADYPSVSIRMIDNLARLVREGSAEAWPAGQVAFLSAHAAAFAEHAGARAETAGDRDDIAAAWSAFEAVVRRSGGPARSPALERDQIES